MPDHPASLHDSYQHQRGSDSLYDGNHVFNNWWNISINAPDQLRQRVAFALSEIMVVSDQGVLQDRGTALTSYYDMLADNAFGNSVSCSKP